MCAALSVAALLLAGCLPDLGGYAVGERRDAGPRPDVGPGVDGGGAGVDGAGETVGAPLTSPAYEYESAPPSSSRSYDAAYR